MMQHTALHKHWAKQRTILSKELAAMKKQLSSQEVVLKRVSLKHDVLDDAGTQVKDDRYNKAWQAVNKTRHLIHIYTQSKAIVDGIFAMDRYLQAMRLYGMLLTTDDLRKGGRVQHADALSVEDYQLLFLLAARSESGFSSLAKGLPWLKGWSSWLSPVLKDIGSLFDKHTHDLGALCEGLMQLIPAVKNKLPECISWLSPKAEDKLGMLLNYATLHASFAAHLGLSLETKDVLSLSPAWNQCAFKSNTGSVAFEHWLVLQANSPKHIVAQMQIMAQSFSLIIVSAAHKKMWADLKTLYEDRLSTLPHFRTKSHELMTRFRELSDTRVMNVSEIAQSRLFLALFLEPSFQAQDEATQKETSKQLNRLNAGLLFFDAKGRAAKYQVMQDDIALLHTLSTLQAPWTFCIQAFDTLALNTLSASVDNYAQCYYEDELLVDLTYKVSLLDEMAEQWRHLCTSLSEVVTQIVDQAKQFDACQIKDPSVRQLSDTYLKRKIWQLPSSKVELSVSPKAFCQGGVLNINEYIGHFLAAAPMEERQLLFQFIGAQQSFYIAGKSYQYYMIQLLAQERIIHQFAHFKADMIATWKHMIKEDSFFHLATSHDLVVAQRFQIALEMNILWEGVSESFDMNHMIDVSKIQLMNYGCLVSPMHIDYAKQVFKSIVHNREACLSRLRDDITQLKPTVPKEQWTILLDRSKKHGGVEDFIPLNSPSASSGGLHVRDYFALWCSLLFPAITQPTAHVQDMQIRSYMVMGFILFLVALIGLSMYDLLTAEVVIFGALVEELFAFGFISSFISSIKYSQYQQHINKLDQDKMRAMKQKRSTSFSQLSIGHIKVSGKASANQIFGGMGGRPLSANEPMIRDKKRQGDG